MLFVQLPALVITLPCVIAIEAYLCTRIAQTRLKASFGAAIVANLISTLFGFPLLWGGLLLLELAIGGGGVPKVPEPWLSIYTVTAQAPWLLPYEDRLYWMVPTAMLVLLVPAFFVSVFIESFIYKRLLRDQTA